MQGGKFGLKQKWVLALLFSLTCLLQHDNVGSRMNTLLKKFAVFTLMILMIASCKKAVKTQPSPTPFKNVVILGNSITFTPQNLPDGWYGNWGLAATAADSDYVHHLTVDLKKVYPACTVAIRSIVPFESDWNNYNLDTNLSDLKALNPDLVILRIGENVNQVPLDTASFGAKYKALVQYFGTKTVVLGVGSLWSRPVTDGVMAKYSTFITLAPLSNDLSIYSYGAWADPAIEQHPNNKGMREIAEVIWAKIQTLTPVKQ